MAPLHGDAQLIPQRADRADVPLQHQLTLIAGCSPGDRRRDGRVAIAIGSDPGAKRAEGGLREADVGVIAAQCGGEAPPHLRHRVKEHLLEIVQGGIDFVEHRGLELVQFIGAPPELNLLLQLPAKVVPFLNGDGTVRLQALQQ